MWNKLNRRDFVKSAVGAGAAMQAFGRAPAVSGSVMGANGHINVARDRRWRSRLRPSWTG